MSCDDFDRIDALSVCVQPKYNTDKDIVITLTTPTIITRQKLSLRVTLSNKGTGVAAKEVNMTTTITFFENCQKDRENIPLAIIIRAKSAIISITTVAKSA